VSLRRGDIHWIEFPASSAEGARGSVADTEPCLADELSGHSIISWIEAGVVGGLLNTNPFGSWYAPVRPTSFVALLLPSRIYAPLVYVDAATGQVSELVCPEPVPELCHGAGIRVGDSCVEADLGDGAAGKPRNQGLGKFLYVVAGVPVGGGRDGGSRSPRALCAVIEVLTVDQDNRPQTNPPKKPPARGRSPKPSFDGRAASSGRGGSHL